MNRILVFVLILFLTSCGDKDSKIRGLDDYDLAQRYEQCRVNKPTAPGKGQACENLRRECERRKKALGTYICSAH